MTDREMLEKAANAAGYACWQSKHGYLNVTAPNGAKHSCCHDWARFDSSTGEQLPAPSLADAVLELNWNPLTDDGDALRLAVRLHMLVDCDGQVYTTSTATPKATGVMKHAEHGDDPYAATRRAIVRAAAAIGDAMP